MMSLQSVLGGTSAAAAAMSAQRSAAHTMVRTFPSCDQAQLDITSLHS
jgi:hypothetical protein